MAQQEALAFLQQAKLCAQKNLQDLEEAERQVRGADDGAAVAIMAGEAARATSFHDQEIAALEAFADGRPAHRRGALSGPAAAIGAAAAAAAAGGGAMQRGASREAPPATATQKPKPDMESRLRAMGAVPALGGLMKSHSASRAMLKSPAVREASQRDQQVSSDGDGSHLPDSPGSWQEELRARRLNPTPSRAAPRTPSVADVAVNDELATMFARRQIGA